MVNGLLQMENVWNLLHKCKDKSKDIGFNIDLPISNKFYVLEPYNCCVNHNIVKFIGISSKQYKTGKERVIKNFFNC
jgi:hypothetical protein